MVIPQALAAGSGWWNIGASWLSNACPASRWMWHSIFERVPRERAHALGLLPRDVGVLAAEVEQDRAADLLGAIEHPGDPGPVVANGRVGIALHRHLVSQRPAEAETEHAGLAAGHLGHLAESFQRGDRVADRERVVELLGGVEGLAHALLGVLDRDAGLDPPVQVRGERHVADAGEALGHLLDVAADAEDLLEHDDPGSRARRGERHVRVEVPIWGAHPLDSRCGRHSAEAYPAGSARGGVRSSIR